MQKEKLIPAIRVDGGKKLDLAEMRMRRQKARRARAEAPPLEDTRVSDVWAREEARITASDRDKAQAKRIRRLEDGGKDGTKLTKVTVRISTERSERKTMRCRPGTFEWRYGRNKQDALFHAGNHFARLWEQAGTAGASSPSMEEASGSAWRGLPDGRVAAIDVLNAASFDLGRLPMSRLLDYCVSGFTTSEIAKKHGQRERDIAAVLHQDLRACAMHFNYL